jgi:hypothetical protein
MFDWNAENSDSSGNSIVSSYFWIYWVITIPLTGLVGAGWRFWWTWEKRNFDADILQEIEKIERPSVPIQLPHEEFIVAGFGHEGRKSVFRHLRPRVVEEHK